MQEKTTGYFKLMDKILSFIFPMVGVGDLKHINRDTDILN